MASSAINRISEEIKTKTSEVEDRTEASESEQKESSKQVSVYIKKYYKPALVIIIIIWLLGQCVGNNSTSLGDSQSADYSWVCGVWKVTTGLEKQTICFLDNGIYIRQRQGHGSYAKSEETGSYYIQSDKSRIQLKDVRGRKSYIDIDIEDKQLKKYGIHYKRISR